VHGTPGVDGLTPALYRELVDRYGSPLFVYDGATLLASLDALVGALPPPVEVFYSLKANPNVTLTGLLAAHGARAEVSSLVELQTALRAGVCARDIIFLGPGKSRQELAACLDARIYAIVAESLDELRTLDRMAGDSGVRARVLVRVNPATAPPGARLAMGGKPRQFGIDENELLAAGDLPARYPSLYLAGVHAYLGTRILDPAVVVANTRHVLDLAERVAGATGIELAAVDVGGGLGVAYFDREQDPDLDELRTGMRAAVEPFLGRHPGVRLLFEAGRFLAGPAGVYVVRVGTVKRSLGKWFAVTDGGTHQHMAAVGIGSIVQRNFPVRALTRPGEPTTGRYWLTGPLCTPNDVIAAGAELPELAPGDLIGILRSGAYGPTASPGLFLGHGFPAEVLVHEGRSYLIRYRDELEDLLRKQIHHQFTPAAGRPRAASSPQLPGHAPAAPAAR
jgi:diaminopimelate decarboxylase